MNGCFQTYSDNCIDYTGLSELGLNIQQGKDTVQSVLEKLISAVKILQQQVAACGSDNGHVGVCDADIEATTKIRSGVNTSDFVPSTKPYTLKTVPSVNNVAVNYDIKDAIPEGSRVISTKVVVNGNNNGQPSRVADSKAITGGFTLKPENFPATIDVEARVQTEQGERILRSTQPLDSTGQDVKPFLNMNTPSGKTAETQSDVNEILDKEVVKLQNQVNSINNISVSGLSGSTPNEVINNLFSEVMSLKEEINNLKNTN